MIKGKKDMKLDVLRKRNKNLSLILIIIIALLLICSDITNFSLIKGVTSIPKAFTWIIINFIPDAESISKVPSILSKLIETIFLAISSTTVGGIFALFLSLLGSKTTMINEKLSIVARIIASIFRNIPDAVWAMVFLFSFGQNVLTGYFALFFVSFGVLTRAFIETIDETSKESVEALKATGASYYQIIFQGVIPASIPQMISWILYMIETNIRSSTLIGILTGTGVGFVFDLYYKSMNYPAASLVLIGIVISVFFIEFTSNYVRRVIL